MRSKASPPKKNENQEKHTGSVKTQKNSVEDSLSKQLNCSEQNSPAITYQNEMIGDQGLDLELKDCSLQNTEAKLKEEDEEI